MVRVPGSVGDSGFHRESQEDVHGKVEQGKQASSDLGTTMMPLNESRTADQQSVRRNSADGREDDLDPDPDLEDKPLPPQVPAGTPATKQGKRNRTDWSDVRSKLHHIPKDPPVSRSDKKKPKTKIARKKMKAP
ncbi:LOW QUALITY PROTEIN: hypothetical protein PHPALM_30088 [Phytophthora palmivora]|uniref:Uncharacterized protein n=1 Tax=Phytophthora palmivora TaxID=4796 RepID=A0A2P4X5Z0_9STRA|nr:LOW QUALITY PROTEIN: hypothetical protein PHPALM_30088 [Phytophthora palmivora]